MAHCEFSSKSQSDHWDTLAWVIQSHPKQFGTLIALADPRITHKVNSLTHRQAVIKFLKSPTSTSTTSVADTIPLAVRSFNGYIAYLMDVFSPSINDMLLTI